jgi:hypothetical protein
MTLRRDFTFSRRGTVLTGLLSILVINKASFKLVRGTLAQNQDNDPSMKHPGYPPGGPWFQALPDDCEILSFDISPPRLSCGVSFAIDFYKDEKYNDQLIQCKKAKPKALYRRGWTVEY